MNEPPLYNPVSSPTLSRVGSAWAVGGRSACAHEMIRLGCRWTFSPPRHVDGGPTQRTEDSGAPELVSQVAQALLKKGNLRKLLDVFRMLEDLEDAEGLANCFKAVKGIVLLNDTHLFELLLSEEMVMDVVGALEYDPELLTKQNHRAFLKESVVFKEVCAASFSRLVCQRRCCQPTTCSHCQCRYLSSR